MIRILTKKEYTFMIEFGALIKKYGVLFTPDGASGINLTVFAKESIADKEVIEYPELHQNEYDEGHTVIHFPTRFDYFDVEVVLDFTNKSIKILLEEEKERENAIIHNIE